MSNSSYKSKSTPKYNKKGNTLTTNSTSGIYIFPIIFIIAILPLVVKKKTYQTSLAEYQWFATGDTYNDYFQFYKQWIFIIVSLIMLIVIIRKIIKNRRFDIFSPSYIPLAAYTVLALLSSVFSKYKGYSLTGEYEQFESVFVLLGYCLLAYYISMFVKTEKDIEIIIKSLLVSAIVLSVLGLTQYLGHDFFSTYIGKKLITPSNEWHTLDAITFAFEKNRVYLTFYNPNYVGSYMALVLPILSVLILFLKNIRMIPIYLLAIAGLLVSLIGSKSTAGVVGIFGAAILMCILLWRYLLKFFYISIPIILIIIFSILIFNKSTDFITNNINKITNIQKTDPALQAIETNDADVTIHYKENIMKILFSVYDENNFTLAIIDQNGQQIPATYNPADGTNTIDDDRFPGFVLAPIYYGDIICFQVKIDGKAWTFTNQTEDGTYYLVNNYGRLDKVITPPSTLLTGYEAYASGRGYIWSRTLPILKKHLILGSGADTYALEFPHQDYVGLYNHGYNSMIITKPHSLYLQIGAQTGVLSLIAFLVFYAMYFISSIRLYIRGRFENYYARIGAAILVGTFAYMISSIGNDSSITVAPVFWVLIGLGITINKLAKPSIIGVKVEDKKPQISNQRDKETKMKK